MPMAHLSQGTEVSPCFHTRCSAIGKPKESKGGNDEGDLIDVMEGDSAREIDEGEEDSSSSEGVDFEGDCSTFSANGARWFKLDADGYDPSFKAWAAAKLIAGTYPIVMFAFQVVDNNSWTSTFPADLAPTWLMRNEMQAVLAPRNMSVSSRAALLTHCLAFLTPSVVSKLLATICQESAWYVLSLRFINAVKSRSLAPPSHLQIQLWPLPTTQIIQAKLSGDLKKGRLLTAWAWLDDVLWG
ncbi:hypothetical protein D9619_002012 [Psilocybe cf. subviscida]|uniref:AA9 family lytic polysaccharide monooxygenase n=1 Tax=Psilocybe cf. subviscida TaxID=2480587 RepID=A0A8H5BH23_9AGAR|nr:hypothetical protein D9619_002012 [Psilocybe cf. subviscida]